MIRLCILSAMAVLISTTCSSAEALPERISLPEPIRDSQTSVEEALEERRSIRGFDPEGFMSLDEVSQILWSAQGITARSRLRTAPSAGALYPFTIYLVAERVPALESGVYIYSSEDHTLEPVASGEFMGEIASASLEQSWIAAACITVAMVADYSVISGVYGNRGDMYTHMEAGHISQNIYLQCVSLGLGTCAVGAFDEDAAGSILQLDGDDVTLYLMPVGVPY